MAMVAQFSKSHFRNMRIGKLGYEAKWMESTGESIRSLMDIYAGQSKLCRR
jgi:hypothetical protein